VVVLGGGPGAPSPPSTPSSMNLNYFLEMLKFSKRKKKRHFFLKEKFFCVKEK
jgi:hypothetical protein